MADLLLFPTRPGSASALPEDWRERERALDTRASWIVEAPAGSGKTGLLIQRYLKLLGDASVEEPEQVLAITFTKKATAELRNRVLGELEGAALGKPVEGDFEGETRELAEAVLARDVPLGDGAAGWELIAHPRRLNIRTIDSVCAEIARALPVLSGSGGRQTPVEDASALYKDAARRTLMHLGGGDVALNDAIGKVVQHRDGDLGNVEGLLAEMLEWRDQWGSLVPLGGEEMEEGYLDGVVLAKLERALELAICQALTQLSRVLPAAQLQELTDAAAEFAHLEGYDGNPSPIAFCAGRTEAPEARAEHLAHWKALVDLVVTPSTQTLRKGFNSNHVGFATQKDHKERLRGIVERMQGDEPLLEALCCAGKLPPAKYPGEQWVVAKALFHLLRRALVELQLVFAERGECDFAELGLAARAALRSDAGADDLAAALGMRTRHLLVDEMQDTSTSQYELIEQMTQGWDGQSQTVFLVGDPKQSIYRFRQARVERFVRTMHEERLGEMRLGCLRLSANFRSQAGLVDDYNSTFSRLLPDKVDIARPEDVPYAPAAATRERADSGGMTWHMAVIDGTRSGVEKERARVVRARRDAAAIGQIARNWLRRPLPAGRERPWSVAVLVRARQHVAAIVAELKKDGGEGAVPFRAVKIVELGERQEVLDLLALTRALLHPADRVAWLAILRAPWCGLGLADLHRLAGADDRALAERSVAELMRGRGHLLSVEGEDRLARVWTVMEAAAMQRGRLPLAQWVERTWRSLGGDTYLGAEEQANAARFFCLLDELEEAGGRLDLKVLKERMKRLYAEQAAHPGAVDLMTIHGAKGLEWDVVIVPALEKRSASDRGRLLSWVEVDGGDNSVAHVVLAPILGRGDDSAALNDWIKSVHARREVAERKRLLYVACTRAREELHLFAAPKTASKGKLQAEASSLLQAAWPVAEEHFRGVQPDDVESGAPFGGMIGDLAAAGEQEAESGVAARTPMILERLPGWFDPEPVARAAGVPRLPYGRVGAQGKVAFERPEGSFAARAFGNTVHAFLDLAAQRMTSGAVTARTLRGEVAGWLPRVSAVMRAGGLPPGVVASQAAGVIAALTATLDDAHGRWILEPHPEAESEYAVAGAAEGASLRLDRVFRGGATPLAPGAECLWIVDYKTGSHGQGKLDEFIAQEREKYKPQLEAYAKNLAQLAGLGEGGLAAMRVALYYPVLSQLTWWVPGVDGS